MTGRRLQEGDAAPDFMATASDGTHIQLSALKGVTTVVIAFYPRDFTPGCTREMCLLRDRAEEFNAREAVVLAISRDSDARHTAFASAYGIPFRLLSDPGGQIARRYGVRSYLGPIGLRVSFVIDRQGNITKIVRRDLLIRRHVEEVLGAVRQLKGASVVHASR